MKGITSYAGATSDTPVSAVWRNGKLDNITATEMVNALKAAIVEVGEEKLGIKKEEVGTHSIRSGAAMTMYMGECPVYTIMMIGRWSSNVFLRYIRKQVEQFSHNISCRMLRFEEFRHISDLAPMISHLDPRQRNHPDNTKTRRNDGGNSNLQAQLPAFSLFN